MVDTPRRSSRSKSPSTNDVTDQADKGAEVKSAEQLAEEREKRRERLLAGREARLSKIVSSVGGSNFTPPLADLPAGMPKPPKAVPKQQQQPVEEAQVRSRNVAVKESVEAVATPSLPSQPPTAAAAAGNGHQCVAGGACCMFTTAKFQTLLMVLINLFAMVAGRVYLGRECVKQVFTTTSALSGDCKVQFDTFRKAYIGMFVSTVLFFGQTHLRNNSIWTLPAAVFPVLYLWLTMLLIAGVLVQRFQ